MQADQPGGWNGGGGGGVCKVIDGGAGTLTENNPPVMSTYGTTCISEITLALFQGFEKFC